MNPIKQKMIKNDESLETVHTHTHTHTCSFIRVKKGIF